MLIVLVSLPFTTTGGCRRAGRVGRCCQFNCFRTPIAVRSERAATQQRIEARISADEKRLLEDAAQRRGMTLTAFVLSTAHEAAVRTLETAHVVELTRQDQQRFVDTLLIPPAPSERLRAAVTDYGEHTSRAANKSRR